MNVFEQAKKNPIASFLSSPIALVLIISTLLWATGLPLLVSRADAAQLTLVSDTLTDSNPSTANRNVIKFTSATSSIAGQTIAIVWDPVGSAFSQVALTATTTQITVTGMTLVTTCGGAADEVTVQQVYTAGSEGVVFTVCATDTVTPGAKIITLGTSTPFISNPAAAGSYRITVTGTNGDTGEARVAILPHVTVTAAVDTTFTFTVAGLATSTTVNGDTLTGSTTATVIAFGTLAPTVAKIMGQQLSVTTNASNGFSVTVVENQNLLSATGADIDLFQDGAATAVPIAWASPTNTLAAGEASYGHIGVTSEDTTLSAGAEFSGTKYAGNFNTARQVFYSTTPADGTTAGVGTTKVAYKVEIGSLQEAGSDYTNILTYVATPIF